MRLIDADALIEDLHGSLFYSDAIPFVEEAPTVEAKPVAHGEWIYTFMGSRCSVCGYDNKNEMITRSRYDSPYCPHCGADMRKDVE